MEKVIIYGLAFIGLATIVALFVGVSSHALAERTERTFWKKQKKYAQDIAMRINSAHYYFSGDPKLFNLLFLVQYFIKEYGYLRGEWLREKIDKLGDRRYSDISQEELNDILKS